MASATSGGQDVAPGRNCASPASISSRRSRTNSANFPLVARVAVDMVVIMAYGTTTPAAEPAPEPLPRETPPHWRPAPAPDAPPGEHQRRRDAATDTSRAP